METTVIALIAATLFGFVFWLFSRRTKLRSNAEDSHRLSHTSNTITDKLGTASQPSPSTSRDIQVRQMETTNGAGREVVFGASDSDREGTTVVERDISLREVDRTPESQPNNPHLEVSESESGVEAKEQVKQQPSAMPRPSLPAQSHVEPGVADQKNVITQISAGVVTATVTTERETEAGEPHLDPSSTETLPADDDKLAADIATPDNNGQSVPEQQAASQDDTTPTTDDDQQVRGSNQETESAPVFAHPPNGDVKPNQTAVGAEQTLPSENADQPADEEGEKGPQRYRPPPQKAPRQVTTRTADQVPPTRTPSETLLEIRVRLTFDSRFGFCEIGLLPERTSQLDAEVTVKFRGTPLQLVAQEDWYQDLQFENIGEHLQQGLELKGRLVDDRRVRWLLTGRPLWVLASHQSASGFISTSRLALGRSHVVLCEAGLLQQVEAVLSEAGCEGYTKLDQSHGVPPGWVALRGVSPTNAIPLNLGSDPFYAVKPAPDIEIQLEGGVRLRNSVWLAGYPPRIKLLGQSNGAVKVLIDGKEAQHTPEGFLIVDDYDRSGQQHSVYCEGLSCSCSYSIEDPPDSWQEWPAYRFGHAEICGPLTRPLAEAANRRAFTVPMSNPLLLGAEPGQIFRCSIRSAAHWRGFVPFEVVWALPAYPPFCDKRTARILQLAHTPVLPTRSQTRTVLDWCKAILDASRKGLRVGGENPESATCWREYKKAARKIWRASR